MKAKWELTDKDTPNEFTLLWAGRSLAEVWKSGSVWRYSLLNNETPEGHRGTEQAAKKEAESELWALRVTLGKVFAKI